MAPAMAEMVMAIIDGVKAPLEHDITVTEASSG